MRDDLILDIMSRAIKINNNPNTKVAVRFEFYSSIKVFQIDIYVNGKTSNGLTKSWSVDTTDKESLEIVKKDLYDLELPEVEINEDDFLG